MNNNNINVDIENIPDVQCSNCDSVLFRQATKMKFISRLISPNGQEGYISIPVMICDKCNTEFSPEK